MKTPRPKSINIPETWRKAEQEIKTVLSGCPAAQELGGELADEVEKAFEILSVYGDHEAYEIAKRLDGNCGWNICGADVEHLQSVQWKLVEALKELVREWVSENGVETPFGEGDAVKFGRGGEIQSGIVDRINAATAQVVVRVDDSGRRPVVNVEDVELVRRSTDNQVSYKDFAWLLNCAMIGIESGYKPGAPRRAEMQELTERLRGCAQRLEPIIVLHDAKLDDDLEKEGADD